MFHNVKYNKAPAVLPEPARTSSTRAANGIAAGHAKAKNVIQSVDRALDILEILKESRALLSVSQVSAQAGLKVSTCHHLLSTLVRRGYVSQDPRTRAYGLGNKIFDLADARSRQIDLIEIVLPLLRDLNASTTEAVHLAVIEAYELATLVKLDSLHAVKVDSGTVGKAAAAHATATGKAQIAFWPPSALDALIQQKGLTRFTPNTICDYAQLRADLAQVRARGYSEDHEEFQPGVVCIGAPIYNRLGEVAASLSCSIPAQRANAKNLRRIRDLVMKTAAAASQQLGHPAPQFQGRQPRKRALTNHY